MIIKMSLNSKSIENAIKQLKKAQSQLDVMLEEFLMTCCTYIYDKANENIINSDIGQLVKENIIAGWKIPELRKEGEKLIARLRNTDDQACFVEFGVGIVGQDDPHPEAKNTNYEYNIGQTIDENGMWWFWSNINELDIPLKDADFLRGFQDHRGRKGHRILVGTSGAKGVWYAYNACVDLQVFEFNRIWEKIKKKYWG